MKYYLIAGEASGDLHGANLMKGLKQTDPDAQFRVWGGDHMQEQAGAVVRHIRDLAFMGFVEVLLHLPAILKNLRFCKEDILRYQPDVVILIDYPGFNFRLFSFLRKHHFKIVYYISPQLWAWKKNRVYTVKKYVDLMIPIFPFEQTFYRNYGIHAPYFGHPLPDAMPETTTTPTAPARLIALLPGSRKQEIQKMLPVYLQAVKSIPGYRIAVAGLSVHGKAFYEPFLQGSSVELWMDQTYALLSQSRAALVTSGTATVEACLLGVPQVIAYRANPLSYWIGRMMVDVPFIGMVNLIANRAIVPEMLQQQCQPELLKQELISLLDGNKREQQLQDYRLVQERLGPRGASLKIAAGIVSFLKDGKLPKGMDPVQETI